MQDHGLDYLNRLDAWLDGEDEGVVPLDLLRSRGVNIPPAGSLDEAALSEALWSLLCELPEIGIIVTSTDHLSDRELYERLTEELLEPTFLTPEVPNAYQVYDFAGSGSEEDIQTYLTYYADDETRARWVEDFPGDSVPPKRKPPYDRDRLLETIESSIAERDARRTNGAAPHH